jgi:16S rRNA (guanine527-N7)-methyltransferase
VLERQAALTAVLLDGQALGFIGPGPIDGQVEHALGFARAWLEAAENGQTAPAAFGDLGSGGGLPGLVLACQWPESRVILIESAARRAAFLERAIRALDLGERATLLHRRAEDAGHEPAWRGTLPLVVARGFGPPAVVAECGAPLLRVGGLLIVSEPPNDTQPRWSADGLSRLGLEVSNRLRVGASYQVLRQVALCPQRYPRRAGIPAKRPLF